MGKDNKTALQLSELASRFQNIADTEIDAATAAKFINSQLKAFGDTSSLKKFTTDFGKAEHVIDATNEVANNFAVGTNDLQNALTKAGSAMSVAGNSFEQTIGMVTAGTEIMVGQPAKVGRGLRSIAINISKLAQESATFEAANGKVNIELQKSNGEMRSTYDIMNDLGKVWNDLNETEQTAIATTLAGKTQFEVFANVMKNWESATNATKTAMDAQGSSMRENEKYLDSIEGKLQAFQSAWEQLSFHVVNSDMIKDVIDFGTQIITVIDNVVQKIGALPTLIGLIGTAIGGLKLLKVAEGFLGIGKAAEKAAEGVEAIAGASAATSGTKGLGGLKNIIGFLTNPMVLGGLAALAATIAAIEFDKYFSFDSSIKRLDEYSSKLQTVTDEIEALKKKRDSDEGLTNAEKTHLAVLEAEERSLERQIALEKQRVQNAFKKDVSTNQGKRYQERTGPTQLLDYQDSRKKELDLDKQIVDVENQIADARKKAQYYRMTGDDQGASTWEAQAQAYEKQLEKLGQKYTELDADAAEAASNLAAYWEEVSANVDYDSLGKVEKEKFDEIHKAFLESQIDASNLKDSYTDVADVLNSAMDSLGHDNLNLFDNIDISSIQTVEDAVNAIKEQIEGLDDDAEITFSVKDENGDIEEITKKVSEITDEDIEAMVHFNAEGVGEVEAEADNAARTRDSVVQVAQEGAQAVSGVIDDAAKDRDSNIDVSQSGASTAKSAIDSAAKNRTTVISVVASGISAVKNALAGIGHASGKRKGEEGGLAWLGDEGSSKSPKPELVVSEDGTAYLAGTTGWELHSLKDSDTVYSYSDTKKLLGNRQSFVGAVGEIPRYKKGKKKKTKKQKKREEFDKKLDKLKHKQKVNHWTDKKFQSEYSKLYKKYKKWLSKDQKWERSESREDYENERDKEKFEKLANDILSYDDLKSFKTKVNANKNLSADEKAELIQDAGNKYYSNEFDRRLGNLGVRGADSSEGAGARLANYLADVKKNKYLSVAEKEEYARKGYEAVAKYNLKEYKNGVKTREETLKSIKDYYNEVGKYDETYYEMLDELREADKNKEIERLQKLQQYHDDRLSLAQKYIQKELNVVQKQIDAEQEEADTLERLNELEQEVAKAKSSKVRIYREGIGFVYERNTEAIEKAEKALNDYQRSLNKSPLEAYAEQLQSILDLFDELRDESEIKELELSTNVGSLAQLLGGNFGTNTNLWSKWISNEMANSAGYGDLVDKLGDVATSQITSWLTTADHTQVSQSLINSYLNKHKFASGTLSASGGLSLLGEHGAELAWLGKGDSVYSNAISRNLMEWGKYSPAQVARSMHKSNSAQVFNFDKIVLPNVRNAEEFYKELQSLPNKILQQSTRRA